MHGELGMGTPNAMQFEMHGRRIVRRVGDHFLQYCAQNASLAVGGRARIIPELFQVIAQRQQSLALFDSERSDSEHDPQHRVRPAHLTDVGFEYLEADHLIHACTREVRLEMRALPHHRYRLAPDADDEDRNRPGAQN